MSAMERTYGERVADEVRAEAARRRVTGRQLATALGISEMSMSRRLNGHHPLTVDEIAVIAVVLGMSVHDLMPEADGVMIRLELAA